MEVVLGENVNKIYLKRGKNATYNRRLREDMGRKI